MNRPIFYTNGLFEHMNRSFIFCWDYLVVRLFLLPIDDLMTFAVISNAHIEGLFWNLIVYRLLFFLIHPPAPLSKKRGGFGCDGLFIVDFKSTVNKDGIANPSETF